MRLGIAATCTGFAILVAGVALDTQFDRDRVIPGGGIFVPGWTGKIDPSSARQGRMLNDSTQEGGALHVTAGPTTNNCRPSRQAVAARSLTDVGGECYASRRS